MKPLGKVKLEWSPEFAYAIGLITTDGCLYDDGRHIELTSDDIEQLMNFQKCLGINVRVGAKRGGTGKVSLRVQFGDVTFYDFLLDIGIMPRKSKILNEIAIPDAYFFDFLRGHFDGDGTFYSYWDARWRSSFMFYTEFISASKNHVDWIRKKTGKQLGIRGHISQDARRSTYQLKYGKKESLKLLPKLYYNADVVCLSRKRAKIESALATEGQTIDRLTRGW